MQIWSWRPNQYQRTSWEEKKIRKWKNLSTRLSHLENNNQNKDKSEDEANVDKDIKNDEDTLVNDDQSKSSDESKKRKIPSDCGETSSKKTSKMDILRKEIEVYDDTLKGLRNFKFKIRSTKKEESIKNLKNLVKEKQKILENFSNHNIRGMVEYIEDTNKELISYNAKTFSVKAEKDIDKLIKDIEKAMDMMKKSNVWRNIDKIQKNL